MSSSFNTEIIVSYLADEWATRLPVLENYLWATFDYSPVRPQKVERLFICVMADADVASNNIGGLYAQKWVLTHGVLEAVPLDFAYDEMYVTDESGDMFLSPSFLFCCQNDVVLLSERYGPSLVHRSRGTWIVRGEFPTIEWTTLWRSTPND